MISLGTGATKFMKASALCIALLKDVEGWKDRKYKDGANKWTIGFGHLIKDGEVFDEPISQEKGEELLRSDISLAEECVNRTVKVPLRQHQFDALVSFVYNVGVDAWRESDTLDILNSGEHWRIPARLMMWGKVKDPATGVKKDSEGLLRRRLKEADLWRGL